MVFNLALQYVQNMEDAQEITQDVFVAIHESLAKFESNSKITTWIYRIAINKSLDFIKAKRRKKRFGFIYSLFHEESGELKYEHTDNYHPGIAVEEKEQMNILFSHINELKDNQRTALILNKIEQKSVPEIAEIMNMSTKAIESLVQRAKNNLKEKLKETNE